MTVITRKQIESVTELCRELAADFDMSKFSQKERDMFITLITMLGLRVTKVDGITCVKPTVKGEGLWNHAKSSVGYIISDMKTRISLHTSEVEDMRNGITAMDELRVKSLMSANEECETEQIKLNLQRLYNAKKRSERRGGLSLDGTLDIKITLSETVLGEKEDMARALKEYADMHDEMNVRFNEKWTMREGARWCKK